jgi:hypothetical protein
MIGRHRNISVFPILFFVFISTISSAQTLRNETLSSIGSSSSISGNGIIVHQSVGQLSVIGNFSLKGFQGNQGFLRGMSSSLFLNEEPFRVIPFPNYFSEQITFKFLPILNEEASFIIYDINGRIVYEKAHIPVDNEVRINLDFLSNAIYLVIISSGRRSLKTRIIKKT